MCDDGACKTAIEAMVAACEDTEDDDKPAFLTSYDDMTPEASCAECGRYFLENMTAVEGCSGVSCSDDCKVTLCGLTAVCNGATQGLEAALEAKIALARTSA